MPKRRRKLAALRRRRGGLALIPPSCICKNRVEPNRLCRTAFLVRWFIGSSFGHAGPASGLVDRCASFAK